jgi:two-component system response regulator GlrR
MKPLYIVMIDLDAHRCPEDHCGQLAKLLRGVFSAPSIDIRSITHFPPETFSPTPDCIILRLAASETLFTAVQVLRSTWDTAPILGLFCIGKVTQEAVAQFLYTNVEDYLSCPLRDIEVGLRLRRLLRDRVDTSPPPHVEETHGLSRRAGIIGESRPLLQVVQEVQRVATCDITVLITGETGTGKELFARAIHYHSARQSKPFVPVACGALPDHLAENELFGHAKGAFTDASSAQKGLVGEAEGGTLFLDEVDTLSAAVQVKILRLLQEHEYRPLGCSTSTTADVRIIAATNADLWQQVQAKRFREDLYYRLNIAGLHLPPLRQRPEDIPLLADYFLRHYGHTYRRGVFSLSPEVLCKLTAYSWPGNVRELESVMQRAVVLASRPVLQTHDIAISSPYAQDMSPPDSFQKAKARLIDQFELTYLCNLLTVNKGNITRAAMQAGKERRAFQRLLLKHRLHRAVQ